jgi:hypothetical protein
MPLWMEFLFCRLSQPHPLGINVVSDGTAHFTCVCTESALTAPCFHTNLINKETVNSYRTYNHCQSLNLRNLQTW